MGLVPDEPARQSLTAEQVAALMTARMEMSEEQQQQMQEAAQQATGAHGPANRSEYFNLRPQQRTAINGPQPQSYYMDTKRNREPQA